MDISQFTPESRLLTQNSKLFAIIGLLVGQTTVCIAQQTLRAASAADSTALFIKSDGNVGIGTANPVNKLQLGGNMHMDGHSIFFRSGPLDHYDFINWSPANDKMDMGGYYGVRLGDTHAGFFPIMTIGRYKPKGTDFVPAVAVDIQAAPRTNPENHPTSTLALYVTGNMNERGQGVEFRENNGNYGLGFTRDMIYSTAPDESMNFEVTRFGNFTFRAGGKERFYINSEGKVNIADSLNIGGGLRLGGQIDWGWPGRNIKQVHPAGSQGGDYYIQFTNSDKDNGNFDGGFRFLSNFRDQTATLRIKNKWVGIGTDDPQAPLNIKSVRGSGTNYDEGVHTEESHEFDSNGGIYMTHGQYRFSFFNNCSIIADGDIVTKRIFVATATRAYSDIRLKKDIRPSSSGQDLATLEKIAVVNYRMIDTIADDQSYKKVIAQQVQKVYPLAVSATSRTLPDVFQHATLVNKQTDSTYLISVAKPENLKAGDLLELKCNPANDVTVMVTKIQDQRSFVVTSATALNDQKSVFVYGHPSNDVLAVDYDAISMLNVSATQQLAKIINEQQKQIELLKKQNADMAKENEKLKDTQLTTKATVDTILARLLQMETNKAGANQPVVASVNQ